MEAIPEETANQAVVPVLISLVAGEVPIDNNVAEQSIRGLCIGKKNWGMIDNVAGAESSANIIKKLIISNCHSSKYTHDIVVMCINT